MRQRLYPLVLAVALASGTLLAVTVVAVRFCVGPSFPAPSKVAVENREARMRAKLEEELRHNSKIIASLQARVAELERQMGALTMERHSAMDAIQTGQVAETALGEVGVATTPPLQAATNWLQQLFPERFADLNTEEAFYLRELDLRGAAITDADLTHLEDLPNLRHLSLRGTAVTDAGLLHIRGLSQLQHLELRGTRILGAGLQHLPMSLESLDLTDTNVSEEAISRLPRLPSLRTMDLNRLALGDAVAEILGRFPELRHLELDGTRITDDGLKRLLELNPALERLELRGTVTSVEAAAELIKTHSQLTIVREP